MARRWFWPFTSNGAAKQTIVAPGMRGAEDFADGLSAAIARGDLLDRVMHVATTRDAKALLADFSAEYQNNVDVPAPETFVLYMRQYCLSLWVYSAVRQIATNLAATPLIAERRVDGGKWSPEPSSELQALLDEPKIALSTYDLVERASTYLETCGSEVIVAERIHGDPEREDGEIIGFVPLRPSLVTINPGGEFIERFEYDVGGRQVTIAPGNAELLRYVHPENDYWGLSPLTPLAKAIAVDAAIEDYNKSFIESAGFPDVVLETEQVIQRENARRIGAEFSQRFLRAKKAGRVPVLDSGFKAKSLALPPKDMQYQDAAKITQGRVLSAYGVPPIMVMDLTEASKLANAEAQVRLFFRFTLPQKSRSIAAAITRLVRPEFGDEWRVRFAFEQAEAIQDKVADAEQARKNYLSGLVTRNEARAAMRMGPAEEGGDEFRAPTSFGGEDADRFPVTPEKSARRFRPQFTPEFKALARSAYERQHAAATKTLRAPMRKFFGDQRDRTLAKYESIRPQIEAELRSRGELVAAGFVPVAKMSEAEVIARIFDTREEAARFIKDVGPVFLLGLIDAANDKIRQLSPSARVALRESHVPFQDFYARWGASRVVDVQEATRDAIRAAVEAGFAEGKSSYEVERMIVSAFRDLVAGGAADQETLSEFPQYRLERISRTEAQVMLNVGSFEGTRELVARGANIMKSWLSARDFIVRESHEAIDRETDGAPIPLTQQFSNGLMHPGDPAGAPEEIINCRCSLIEVVMEEGST